MKKDVGDLSRISVAPSRAKGEVCRSSFGEIGLQALRLSQFPYPLATMLIANGLMYSTLLAPEELPSLLDAIAQG